MVKPVASILFDNVSPINIEKEQAKFVQSLKQPHLSIISIYAFESPREAATLSKLLNEHGALQHQAHIPKYDLLMCNKSYRQEAYDLCVKELFYSYETIKPIYDTNKVILTLRRLAQHLATKVELQQVEQDNLKMEESINSSIESIDALQTQVQETSTQQDSEFEQVTKSLNELLARVPAIEWEKAFTNIVRSMPESVQRTTLSQFSIKEFRDDLEKYRNNSAEMLNKISSSLDASKPQALSKGPLIVVADDQPVMLKIISSILEPKGYKVESASNGVEALMKAKVMKPELILLDIDMPIMDGLATLDAVKKVETIKHIPIIMLTSHSDKDIIKSSISLGAVDYVVKPTKADILLAKIANALK
ncbi:response regulator [Vibrio sp. Isolate23]|uniref:response regulator n=1 Tax=Vibrio sp. Isolate23 TaxID=2908533 RepID=UPI001EFEF128|nr:response regulator [Vibrio sp. Isolate23]MCG9682666.1 response regulator [Vibrio sp. Isolate23]